MRLEQEYQMYHMIQEKQINLICIYQKIIQKKIMDWLYIFMLVDLHLVIKKMMRIC